MEEIFSYAAKQFACSALFFFYYRLFLYNKNFHTWNRIYLISSLLLSVFVPLMKIPVTYVEAPDLVGQAMTALPWNQIDPVVSSFESYSFLMNCFMLISLALFVRIVYASLRLYHLYRKSEVHPLESGVKFVLTNLQYAPFSYFSWLFWRKDIDPESDCGKRILTHELTHITQRHSLDKIFTELIIAVFWINPFFWLIRRELYLIHEFIADRKAVEENDGASFAAMILSSLSLQPVSERGITSPLAASQIKRRLSMITRGKSAERDYLRRLSGLVLMAISFCAVSLSFELSSRALEIPSAAVPAMAWLPSEQDPTGHEDSDKVISPDIAIPGSKQNILPGGIRGERENNKSSVLPEPIGEANTAISPSESGLAGEPEKQGISGSVEREGAANALVSRRQKSLFQTAAVEGSLDDGAKDIEPVVVVGKKTGPDMENMELRRTSSSPVIKLSGKEAAGESPLYILNGEVLEEREIGKIDANSIHSITVYKGEEAIERFGTAAKHGAISISLNK